MEGLVKGLLVGGGFTLSLILGFWPGGLSAPKPGWWRGLTIVALLVLIVLAFILPSGGTFADAMASGMGQGSTRLLPVLVHVVSVEPDGLLQVRDDNDQTQRVRLDMASMAGEHVTPGDRLIFAMNFDHSAKVFVAHRVIARDPVLSLPLTPGLEERARNIYFHVPAAWLSQMAWFISFAFALLYLKRRRMEDDIKASSAAALGGVFCILATVTGSIWARFNWGTFWTWDDARLTSIFIVLLIYGAYFALRASIENEDLRARLSSVYLVLLALPVVYFMFVMPRTTQGLHPGSAGDPNIGPVLSPQKDALNVIHQVLFGLSGFGFTLLFFWMLNVSIRSRLLALRRRQSVIAGEGREPAIAPQVVRLS